MKTFKKDFIEWIIDRNISLNHKLSARKWFQSPDAPEVPKELIISPEDRRLMRALITLYRLYEKGQKAGASK
jgi:hypothetical protein